VRAVIDVDLPRPRGLPDLVESDRANDIKKQALSILHAEAMRSFSRGLEGGRGLRRGLPQARHPRLMEFLFTARSSSRSPSWAPCFRRRPPSCKRKASSARVAARS